MNKIFVWGQSTGTEKARKNLYEIRAIPARKRLQGRLSGSSRALKPVQGKKTAPVYRMPFNHLELEKNLLRTDGCPAFESGGQNFASR